MKVLSILLLGSLIGSLNSFSQDSDTPESTDRSPVVENSTENRAENGTVNGARTEQNSLNTSLNTMGSPLLIMPTQPDPSQLYRILQFRTTATTPLRGVIIQVDERELEIDAEELNRQIQEGRGDDVGNGGDHITERFLVLANDIKQEISLLYGDRYTFENGESISLIDNYLRADNILVVESIEYQNINFNYFVAESKVFLKREFFNNALIEGADLRQKVLHMMILAAGLSDLNEMQSIELYSQLGAKSGLPLCEGMSQKSIKMEPEEFSMSHPDNPDALERQAYQSCQERGLINCRELSSSFSGFAAWARYRITMQGFNMTILNNPDACEEARKCHQLIQLAPIGQIDQQAFSESSSAVLRSCN